MLPSLFEEQIEHEELELHEALEQGAHSFGEALTYLPDLDDIATGPTTYLEHLAAAKEALRIPVIASLNGYSAGGWVRYARLAEEAGADAIELNTYAVEADPAKEGHHVEHDLLELVGQVRAAVSIPLAVKVGPFYSAFANVARRLGRGRRRRDRLLQPIPRPGHRPRDARRAGWRAPLDARRAPAAVALDRHPPRPRRRRSRGHGRRPSAEDAIKLILAGADTVMLASSLLRHGPAHLTSVVGGLAAWLDEHEYTSVDQARGSLSQASCPDPAAFERAQYMRALTTYSARQRV